MPKRGDIHTLDKPVFILLSPPLGVLRTPLWALLGLFGVVYIRPFLLLLAFRSTFCTEYRGESPPNKLDGPFLISPNFLAIRSIFHTFPSG